MGCPIPPSPIPDTRHPIMPTHIPHILILTITLSGTFPASAQLPMPDRVCVGTGRSYWVDSTGNPGSIYTWAINNTVVQSGTTCTFVHIWNTEGTFELKLRQVTAEGCASELRSGQVIVTPAITPAVNIRIFPVPVSGSEISFQLILPAGSRVTVDLFASNGQIVSRVFNGFLYAGESETITYRHQLPQGIYLYQIRTDYQVINGRVHIIRVY